MFGRSASNEDNEVHSPKEVDFDPTGGALGLNKYAGTIRAFVKANPQRILTIEDFNRALGGTTAARYVKRLVDLGVLTRINANAGDKGHHYMYRWNSEREGILTGKVEDNPSIKDLEVFANRWQEDLSTSPEDANAVALMNLGVTRFIRDYKQSVETK